MSTPTKLGSQARAQQRQKVQDGYLQEQHKARQAAVDKTVRLKALRLAKEASDKAAADAKPKSPTKKKAAPKPGTLVPKITVSKQR